MCQSLYLLGTETDKEELNKFSFWKLSKGTSTFFNHFVV